MVAVRCQVAPRGTIAALCEVLVAKWLDDRVGLAVINTAIFAAVTSSWIELVMVSFHQLSGEENCVVKLRG